MYVNASNKPLPASQYSRHQWARPDLSPYGRHTYTDTRSLSTVSSAIEAWWWIGYETTPVRRHGNCRSDGPHTGRALTRFVVVQLTTKLRSVENSTSDRNWVAVASCSEDRQSVGNCSRRRRRYTNRKSFDRASVARPVGNWRLCDVVLQAVSTQP